MISNYLYLISVGVTILTIIFIIYNYILLVKRKKADYRDEDTKQNIINKISSNIATFAVILVICISFIFYYSRSVDIFKTVGIGENINYEAINIYGSTTGASSINLDEKNGKKLFDLLDKYSYKRVFNFNDGASGEGVFILFENTDGKPGTIEIWKNGYISIPNDKLYKIKAEDKEELYIQLSNLLEK